jgi:hypothetical protein
VAAQSGGVGRIGLRSQAEVGERPVAVEVDNELRHLATVDVKHVCSRSPQLPDLSCPGSDMGGPSMAIIKPRGREAHTPGYDIDAEPYGWRPTARVSL